MTIINIRKPVTFSQYYILLVKSGKIWCKDCASWDYDEIRLAQIQEKRTNPKSHTIIATSPTDDDLIVQKIIKSYNR